MALIERRASSLSEIIAEAKAIRDLWNPERDMPEEIWFRGNHKRSDTLLPGLYRPEIVKLGYEELTMFHAFANLGLSYTTRRPANDWEWYFVAQHHGLPTRLLDWTESLLAATYFAIENYWRLLDKSDLAPRAASPSVPVFDNDSPTVWILDAGSINDFAQGQDGLFAPKDEIKVYLPRFLKVFLEEGKVTPECLRPEKPIALHAPRQTARIIAQQGMFTIHGCDNTSLDALAVDDSSGLIRLGCIQLDNARLASLVEELILVGVTRLALFPDLDSVAAHIKWQYRE